MELSHFSSVSVNIQNRWNHHLDIDILLDVKMNGFFLVSDFIRTYPMYTVKEPTY